MYLKAFYTFKNSSVNALLQSTETDYGMLVKRKMYLNEWETLLLTHIVNCVPGSILCIG